MKTPNFYNLKKYEYLKGKNRVNLNIKHYLCKL